jgi:hypothetical protein
MVEYVLSTNKTLGSISREGREGTKEGKKKKMIYVRVRLLQPTFGRSKFLENFSILLTLLLSGETKHTPSSHNRDWTAEVQLLISARDLVK